MRRRLVAVGSWLAATVVAVAIATAGVRLVADRLSQPLAAGVAAAGVATSTATPDAGTSPTRADTVPAGSPSVAPTPDGAGPDEPAPPPAETRTYELVGGSAGVRFDAGRVEVLWATPRPGFRVSVEPHGPGDVEVEFESAAHRSRLRARWDGGPRDDISEEPRGDGGGDGDGDDGGDDGDDGSSGSSGSG